MKRKLAFTLISLFLILCFSFSVFADGITVTLNGSPISFADQAPTIVNGRTLVPLRAIFEALGASVEWDGTTGTVSSQRGETSVSLGIGSNVLYRNGKATELDVPAQIMNGRTMVPARAVAEAYGIGVEWDGSTKTVILNTISTAPSFSLADIPSYSGEPYCTVNGNKPFFTEAELVAVSFEKYASLDTLGRCGVAFACIGKDIMPAEERGSIGSVKPSGWQTVRYEFIDGRYLYNRCHLIGYQLSGENENTANLITGTRHMNTKGMLPFENDVAAYVERTGNHVLYRATPIYDGNDLLASGVLMEAFSVEDSGAGLSFCIYCYNVQPGIVINYADGTNYAADGSDPYGTSGNTASAETVAPSQNTASKEPAATPSAEYSYVGNKNTKRFHYPSCKSVSDMKDKNKVYLTCTRDEAIAQGYKSCGNCHP